MLDHGWIDSSNFGKVLCRIAGVQNPEDLPEGLQESSFTVADDDGSTRVDFREFALWYCRYGLSEDTLLSKEQKEIRSIARRYDLSFVDVEQYKRCFDQFDVDGSGFIDQEEFRGLLTQLLKVPAHMELPRTRMQQFWKEIDDDGSGSAGFEEFILFYMKYFDTARDGACPLVEFYRGIRGCVMRSATT
jgi:Ca2+-binding EF-hand superfamily protein|eukprot:TRINITY_DN4801_c2_g3_i1.p1 TRINITY_DN4801_c2_g3~~TRINITY_DN4801_c2_g3_i1.p1  ORF type:complete len:221 (-),score=79.94 TRINITY_DN4801_c2_g3_i1:392-958(-)